MKKLKRYQYERYAVLCKLAYPANFDHAALGFADSGHKAIRNQHGAVIARILSKPHKKEVIVLFRGTQSIRDWVLNFCLFPTRATHVRGHCPNAHSFVHFGYQHLLNQRCSHQSASKAPKKSIFDEIESYLRPLILAGKRVSFTGHSSGGAMAVLAAQRLESAYPRSVRRVVTFGQPSTSYRKFHQQYLLHKRTFRICCDLDIVTFLPPFPTIFKHVGRSLWLHNERIYENAHPIWRLYRVLATWLISPISYHYMHKYIRDKDFFDEH